MASILNYIICFDIFNWKNMVFSSMYMYNVLWIPIIFPLQNLFNCPDSIFWINIFSVFLYQCSFFFGFYAKVIIFNWRKESVWAKWKEFIDMQFPCNVHGQRHFMDSFYTGYQDYFFRGYDF